MPVISSAADVILKHIQRLGAVARRSPSFDLRARRAAAVSMDAYASLAVHYLHSLGEFQLSLTALESSIAREIRLVDKHWHADSEWIRSLATPVPAAGLVL